MCVPKVRVVLLISTPLFCVSCLCPNSNRVWVVESGRWTRSGRKSSSSLVLDDFNVTVRIWYPVPEGATVTSTTVFYVVRVFDHVPSVSRKKRERLGQRDQRGHGRSPLMVNQRQRWGINFGLWFVQRWRQPLQWESRSFELHYSILTVHLII